MNTSANAGFTNGTPWIKANPNYQEINVAASLNDPTSIHAFYKKMLSFRKAHRTFVYGDYQPLIKENEQLFAYLREDKDQGYYIVLNFTNEDQADFPKPKPNLELLMSNYDHEADTLRPWEARIYRYEK